MDVNTLDFANRAGTLRFSEDGGVTEIAAWAGVLQVNFDSQPANGYFDTLCVDLFHNISLHRAYTVTQQSVDTIANGGRVSWLYTNQVGLGSMQAVAQSLTMSTNEVGMALQLAMWDIIHDNGDGLSAGLVRATTPGANFMGTSSNVVRAVNFFEQASLNRVSSNAAIYVDAVNGISTQRQISVPFALTTTYNAETPTPEPGTLGLAGLVLAGLIGWSRPGKRR